MRFPGTCSMYSKNAMLQLAIAAMNHGRVLSSFKCAYHAKVMKTLLMDRSNTVNAICRIEDSREIVEADQATTGGGAVSAGGSRAALSAVHDRACPCKSHKRRCRRAPQ